MRSALDELQRGERKRRAPIAPGPGQMVEDWVRVHLRRPFEGERRAGVVAQPPPASQRSTPRVGLGGTLSAWKRYPTIPR
jgi:hypothetical protein